MRISFLSLLLVLLCAGVAFAQPAAPTVTGTTTICSGNNTTLTASGVSGAAFKWYDAAVNGVLITNTATYTIPTQYTSGTYHFYAEQSVNSVPGPRTDVIVTVNQTPTVTLNTGNSSICNGGSTTITASGAGTYLWNNGVTTAAQTVSPTATTVYTVTGTTQNCVSAPVTTTISVYKTVVSPAAAVDVCYGANTVLSASGASSYSWSPGGATTAAITVSPTSSTTYTVSGSIPGCVPTTDTVRLNVRPNIGLFAGANQTVAAGSIVALTAGSATATTYTWTPNQGSSQTLSGTAVSVLPTTTTTYTVTGTGIYNCTATAQTVVTVNEQVIVSGTTTVCSGSTTTLTASGTGPFAWYDAAAGGTALATTAGFTTPAITASTAYWVAGSNGVRKKVNISLPSVSNTPFAFPATICAGDTVWLKGREPGPVTWYDAPAGGQLVSGTTGSSGLMIMPVATKTYWAEIGSASVSLDFSAIDAVQTWTVPEGVTSIQVNAYGSKGLPASSQPAKGYSGKGGTVTATLNVTPGQVLNIFVGGTNSWNGGGNSAAGNRGGDATDVRIGGTGLLNRVLVAGGGGGSGWNQSYNNANSNTGAGGGLIGQDGGTITSFSEAPYWLGQGGSQTAGGQEGYQISTPSLRAEPGSFGRGGTSQRAYSSTGFQNTYCGGGGGSGFFGGGGGLNHGDGGGGSSYTNPEYCSNVTMTQGTWNNPGSLTITYSSGCGAIATRIPVTVTVSPLPTIAITSSSLCLGTELTAALSANAAQLQWLGAGATVNTVYPSWNPTATTAAGTTTGSGLNQLSAPQSSFATPNGDLYIPDGGNHRILKWSVGATAGTVVAGGNGAGAGANQLNTPAGVFVDESGTLYIADKGNQRIQKWTAGAASGTTLFGTTGSGGTAVSQLYDPVSITRDDTGRFYITEAAAHRVSRWVTGQPTGKLVAGTAGNSGSGLTQLAGPASAVIDKSGAVYVADQGNNRVVKWAAGATTGTLFAGGNGSGSAANQVTPAGIARDGKGNIYIADGSQNRIQRWVPGDVAGTTVAPLTGSQLTSANGVCFDVSGNMYVTDGAAGQVKKFSAAALTPLTYVPAATGIKSAIVTNAFGCATTSGSITLSDIPTASLSAADSVCVGGATRVLAISGTGALAPYTFQYTLNGGAVQTVISGGSSKVRYIRIRQNLNDWTNLTEVEAIDSATGQNVALNKPATASSNNSGYPASKITDGNSYTYWHSGAPDNQQYVEIDLGGNGYNLSLIKITNRYDCCQDRARDLQLILKDSAGVIIENRKIDAYQNQNTSYTSTFSTASGFYRISVPTTVPSNGIYKLVNVSSGGCVTALNDSTRIKVNAYAHFTTQPLAALDICSGNPFTLSAKAANVSAYQWQKNGGAVNGQTDTSFTTALTALGDAGSYRLIATNVAGCNDTSAASIVTVRETPNATLTGNTAYCKDATGALLTLNSPGINLNNTVQYTLNSETPVSVSLPAKWIRYIRVQRPHNGISDIMGVTEIKAFVPGNPTSVSLGKPVVSSGINTNPIYANANVTDGDLTTSWLNWQYGPVGFVEIDLQNSYPVSQIDLYAGTASGGGFGANNFQLVCKDSLGTVVSDQTTYIYPTAPSSPALRNWPVQVTKSATIAVPTGVAGTSTYRLTNIASDNGCAIQKTDSVSIVINNRAAITAHPVAATNICDNVPFTLSGAGPTALSFRWLKNGTALSNETSATLARLTPAQSDSGIYRLVALGQGGCNDTSTAALVQIRKTPVATITGNNQLCQSAPSPAVTLIGTLAPIPYTFSYVSNSGIVQSAVTDSVKTVRYIRLKQNANDLLALSQIQAINLTTGQNVALGKSVTSSSGSYFSTASAITNGNTSTGNGWLSSNSSDTEYVQIDLGVDYALSSVKIFSQASYYQSTLANVQLILKDAAGNLISSQQVNAYPGQNTQNITTVPLNTRTDRIPLPVSTAVPGDFSYKLLSVTSVNGCVRTVADSVMVTVLQSAKISRQPLSHLNVCTPNPLVLSTSATGAVFYRWQRNGINIASQFDSVYLKTGVTSANAGTYRVLAMTPDGCNDTSANTIVTVGSMSGNAIAVAAAADTQMHTNGLDYIYTNANCEPIAEVIDAAGGNTLGLVKVQMLMDTAMQTFNMQPYLQRHYDISPANNGAATVKLYATQAEFDAYNAYITANSLSTPKLPAGPADTAGISNISITQFHGLPTAGTSGPGGQYNAANKEVIPASAITKTWNGNYWTMSFPVSGFSGFFITSPGNSAPLPLSLTAISARNLGSTNEVLWTTATEDPGTVFEVERSLDATQFSKLGTLQGTGKENTSYRLVDVSPATGINYYRVRAVSAGGESVLSKVVTASVKAGVFVVEAFPNPTHGLVTVRLSGTPGPDATVLVSDVSGKLLWQVPMRGSVLELSLEALAGGLYFLRYQDGVHSQTLKVTKE